MGDAGLEGRHLLSSQWKNSPDVYPPPETHTRSCQVPSLVWFCLQCISEYPDQIQLPIKLRYQPLAWSPPKTFSLFDKLLRSALSQDANNEASDMGNDNSDIDFSTIDPRMWATVIQVFDHIHPQLRSYTISLNDELLPLLQGIQSTESFSLITILELPGCPALTDESIIELRFLCTLAALDASNTDISADGIHTLSRFLRINGPMDSMQQLKGPWDLRILRLKHCRKVGNQVYQYLPMFPLLSVVDLRGTSCAPQASTDRAVFSPSKNRTLFSSNLSFSLDALQYCQKDIQMFSAPEEFQYCLRIKNLCHPIVAKAITAQQHASHELDVYRIQRGRDDDTHNEERHHDREFGDESSVNSEVVERAFESSELDDTNSEERAEGLDIEELNSTGGSPNLRGDLSSKPLPEPRPIKRQRIFDETIGSGAGSDTYQVGSKAISSAARFGNKSGDASSDDDLGICPSVAAIPYTRGGLPRIVTNQRHLHLYDADWQRKYTYVPITLAKSKFDGELMLYRPPQPWHFLQTQPELIRAKELKQAELRATRCAPTLIVPDKNRALDAQQGLRSMATFAVRRRQTGDSQIQHDVEYKSSSRSAGPSMSDERDDNKSELSAPKPLRPISALRIPEFTQEILQEAAVNEEATRTMSHAAKDVTTSTLSGKGLKKGRRKGGANQPGFNWAAWASKKP